MALKKESAKLNYFSLILDMHGKTYRQIIYFCPFISSLMETKFKEKLSTINLHYKIWMSDKKDAGILGDGKWQILKLIDQKGSLKAACDELGYTYRRTWGDLKKIEKFFGFPLLEKHRGGSEGGKTVLTQEGKSLVNAFDQFHASIDVMIQKGFESFIENLK